MESWSDITPEMAAKYDFAGCYTRLNPDGPYNPRDVVAAIFATRGNLTTMAQLIGRRRSKLSEWLNKNIEVQALLNETVDAVLDELEQDTFTSALKGDGQDRRFLLQTLGKDRGYSTRQQVTGRNDAPLAFERIERVIVRPGDVQPENTDS